MTTVSVILPAYNEGPAFGASLVTLCEQFSVYKCYDVQYIIIDDGSTDETLATARAFARLRRSATVIALERHYGIGYALRSAFTRATGEFTIVVAADLSYTPFVAMELLESLDREGADVAIASPYMPGGSVVNVPLIRNLLSRSANRLLSLATKGRYSTLTSIVRAYRTAFLKSLKFRARGGEASAEILLAAVREKARIIEIPARREWNLDRNDARHLPLRNIVRHTWATMRLAFSHRPALIVAIPGVVPGTWAAIITVLLLMHASVKQLEVASAGMIVLQCVVLSFAQRLFRL